MLVLLLKLYLFFKFTLFSNAKNTVKTLFQDYIFIFVTVYAIIDISVNYAIWCRQIMIELTVQQWWLLEKARGIRTGKAVKILRIALLSLLWSTVQATAWSHVNIFVILKCHELLFDLKFFKGLGPEKWKTVCYSLAPFKCDDLTINVSIKLL